MRATMNNIVETAASPFVSGVQPTRDADQIYIALTQDTRYTTAELESINAELKSLGQADLLRLKSQLEQIDWLYQNAIEQPLHHARRTIGREIFPNYAVADFAFQSPLNMEFADFARVMNGLSMFRSMRVAMVPSTSVTMSVQEHQVAAKIWQQKTARWNNWLDLLTRSVFVPDPNGVNEELDVGLFPMDEKKRAAPFYVQNWYLSRFGNVPLANNFRGNQTWMRDGYIRLLDRMARSQADMVAYYGMYSSLNDLYKTVQGVVRRFAKDQRQHIQFIHIFHALSKLGAGYDQVQRVIDLGVPLNDLGVSDLDNIYTDAVHFANYAIIDAISHVFDSKPYLLSQADVERFLPLLVQMRRDMWNYVLVNATPEAKQLIKAEAKAQLGYRYE